MTIKSKKGIELTLQTIVIFIIAVVVLIVIIMFFTTHYGDNVSNLFNIGNGSIEAAKNIK